MMEQIIARFPGVSCSWVDAAGCVTTECWGVADQERNLPVDEDTIFPACSISKFITALCVMKLHERHILDIAAPVNAYLRQWKLRTPEGSESDATIRALMCHTAGIADCEDAFCGLRRSDPEITLLDILEGRTSYNNRPVRAEKAPGTAFEYSDAGYCVLQLLVQEVTGMSFDDAARMLVFDALELKNTFFASRKNVKYYEANLTMATGYDGEGLPLPGKYPYQPDLAASALWSTPKELLAIAKAFIEAYHGRSTFLQEASAREMTKPVEKFPWTGLGLFFAGEDTLMSQGWGENGQCMLKMNVRTGAAAVVMTNRNPEVDQSESKVEWLVDSKMGGANQGG
jgi:CubicO group peptidase (beta-lactamase class C family)